MYDVVIVWAGPAGLFAAYELKSKNKDLKVAIIDRGKHANKRVCPMTVNGGPCINCKPCNILSGYGGAGTFSDGKLNFIPKLGKSDLFKYLNESDAYKIIDDCEEIFTKFGMDAPIYPKNMDEALEFKKEVAKAGAKLLIIKNKHIGSDYLPKCIEEFTNYLKDNGVDTFENTDIDDIINEKDYYKVISKNKEFKAKNVVVAPGRTGAKWVQEYTDKHNIRYVSQSIEICVRVEVRKEIMDDICSKFYEPTIFIKTDTYGDEIRTFCTNPGGFVAKENYEGYICVNGYSNKDVKSNNSNFAFYI